MKKKILDFIIIICIISILQAVLPITVWGVTFTDSIGGISSPSTPILPRPPTPPGSITSGIYTYTVSNGAAIITDCDTSATGAIEIPSTLDEYPVTEIGRSAFYGCDDLTCINIPNGVTAIANNAFLRCDSLTNITVSENNNYYCSANGILFNKNQTTLICYPNGKTATSYLIPDSVTYIGDSAFCFCENLTSVTIGNGVTTIGSSAFENCRGLTSVAIPDSVTTIGNAAFFGCDYLTSITIPNSVTEIGNNAFLLCNRLTDITVSENNNYYCSINGVLFNKSKTSLIYYPIGNTAVSYIIPNNVIEIGNNAFFGCDYLTSIIIPDSVTEIGDYAFSSCVNLISITIPDSVTTIGENVFLSCTNLTSVSIGNSVTQIGNRAFNACYKLTNITIPWSITEIGDYAFSSCASLTSITIPNGVTKIGYSTFKYCTNLTSINIPDSVTEIGDSAFSDCASLTSITIPDTVTVLGPCTFQNCTSLTSITIQNGVTKIGYSTFKNCTSLTDVYYKGTESELESIYIDSYNDALTNATRHYIKHTRNTISEDGKTFYVNPINIETGVSVILAIYNKGELVEAQAATYEGEEITFTTTKSYTNANVIVWDNFTTLNPTCEIEVVK